MRNKDADKQIANEQTVSEIIDKLNEDNPECDQEKSYLDATELEKGERLVFAMNRLSLLLERSKFADYVILMNNTKTMIWKQFLAGIARGLGYGIGFVVLAAIAIYILQAIADLSIPFFADFINSIMEMINEMNAGRHGIS